LATTVDTSIVERVVMQGDLSNLTPQERLEYYSQVCASMGLNPLTRPFDYINLNGKLTLYAKRDAADQLRKLHGISIDKPDVKIEDDLVIVSVTGRDKTGRTDSELGVVYLGKKTGDPKANAILKAITKAKRRLTLSIVGLGWLDETEVDTIPGAQHVYPPEQRATIDESAELAEARRESLTIDADDGGPMEPVNDPIDNEQFSKRLTVEPPTAKRSWPGDTIKAVVDAGHAEHPKQAVAMLNKSVRLVTTDDLDRILAWTLRYRTWRDNGKDSDGAAKMADMEQEQADKEGE
jgi:hypothetical protein